MPGIHSWHGCHSRDAAYLDLRFQADGIDQSQHAIGRHVAGVSVAPFHALALATTPSL